MKKEDEEFQFTVLVVHQYVYDQESSKQKYVRTYVHFPVGDMKPYFF